jgi:hypothetical protein
VESRLLFGHIPTGLAVHYIFSFPKEGKEKDVISIPYAGSWFSEGNFCLFLGLLFVIKIALYS